MLRILLCQSIVGHAHLSSPALGPVPVVKRISAVAKLVKRSLSESGASVDFTCHCNVITRPWDTPRHRHKRESVVQCPNFDHGTAGIPLRYGRKCEYRSQVPFCCCCCCHFERSLNVVSRGQSCRWGSRNIGTEGLAKRLRRNFVFHAAREANAH